MLAAGLNRVDVAKVGQLVGRKVRRANADLVRRATGYAIGGVPPVGLATALDRVPRPGSARVRRGVGGCGPPHAVFPIAPTDLVRVTDGQVADVRVESQYPPKAAPVYARRLRCVQDGPSTPLASDTAMTTAADGRFSSFDVVIVGGGPGGYPAAIRAAQYGLRVALIEKERAGGVCLNWGCIPTKAMLRSAEVLETMQHSADFGILADNVRLDYPAVLEAQGRIVQGLTDGVGQLLKANGVTVINGHARFTAPDSARRGRRRPVAARRRWAAVQRAGRLPRASRRRPSAGKHVIIATGSTPAQLPIPGRRPARRHQLGRRVHADGGAQAHRDRRRRRGRHRVGDHVFGAFGSEVTLVELLPNLLPHRRRRHGPRRWRARSRGAASRCSPARRWRKSRRPKARLQGHHHRQGRRATSKTVDADKVLIGVSRRPNTLDLNLDNDRRRAPISAATSASTINCAPTSRTSMPSATSSGKILLAHVAYAPGHHRGERDRRPRRAYGLQGRTGRDLHPSRGRQRRPDREACSRGGPRRGGRASFPFVALGRAQTFGIDGRADEDRRRQEVRRDPRRAHHRPERQRPDPRGRARDAAGSDARRRRQHDSRAPDAGRGHDGSRHGRARAARPRRPPAPARPAAAPA